jgi:RNA polymerase sigma factor (sigma-70 family)
MRACRRADNARAAHGRCSTGRMSDLSVLDDPALVALCRAGHGAAWAALVHRYQRLVHAIVRRAGLDKESAADVFQTVFLRLLQSLPRIEDPSRLQAWIVTTAKRESLLLRRRGERLVAINGAGDADAQDAFEHSVDEAPGPEQTVEHWQRVMQMRLALDRLDSRCRELLHATFACEPVSYDHLAQRMQMPVGSIGPTRARCLDKLRRALD